MWRRLRWLLLPLILLPVSAVFLMAISQPTARVGEPAPAWELRTTDGRTISSEELRGRPYVLNFWASWCLPACADEHPVLIEAQERHGDEVLLLGVLYRDSPEGAQSFLDRYGDGGWPHLTDPGGELARAFGVLGPPETVFVDADGILRVRQIGPMTTQTMSRQFAALLGDAAAEAQP